MVKMNTDQIGIGTLATFAYLVGTAITLYSILPATLVGSLMGILIATSPFLVILFGKILVKD